MSITRTRLLLTVLLLTIALPYFAQPAKPARAKKPKASSLAPITIGEEQLEQAGPEAMIATKQRLLRTAKELAAQPVSARGTADYTRRYFQLAEDIGRAVSSRFWKTTPEVQMPDVAKPTDAGVEAFKKESQEAARLRAAAQEAANRTDADTGGETSGPMQVLVPRRVDDSNMRTGSSRNVDDLRIQQALLNGENLGRDRPPTGAAPDSNGAVFSAPRPALESTRPTRMETPIPIGSTPGNTPVPEN